MEYWCNRRNRVELRWPANVLPNFTEARVNVVDEPGVT
jgi:hypothetical protein